MFLTDNDRKKISIKTKKIIEETLKKSKKVNNKKLFDIWSSIALQSEIDYENVNFIELNKPWGFNYSKITAYFYNKFINFCNDIIINKEPFALYPSSWRIGSGAHTRTINNGILNLHTFPSNDSIKICCEKHNINLPRQYTTETCAFFICHKNSILKHGKKFYIELREWLLSNNNNGFVLEHIWKLIFTR